MCGDDRRTADEVAGAFIETLEAIRRQVIAIQLTGPQPFEPPALNGDDRLALPQKPVHISVNGLWSGVISHTRAFARDKIVANAIRVDGPDH